MEEPRQYDNEEEDKTFNQEEDMNETPTNSVKKKRAVRRNKNRELNKSLPEESIRIEKRGMNEIGGKFVKARIEELVGKIRSKQDLYYVLHSEMKFYLPDLKN
jgi:hypothetical protein